MTNMELYTLDSLMRRQYVIDQWISLIWTERWQDVGDFQLQVISTPRTRGLLVEDSYLAMNKSLRVMRITSVEDDASAAGARILTVKGFSYESILKDRGAKNGPDDLTTSPSWTLTYPPADLARQLYYDICVSGFMDPSDIISGVLTTAWPSASSIPEPTAAITVDLTPTTLFDAIYTQTCIPYDLGFRMVRDDSTGIIYANVYTGDDRTTTQTTFPAVVFTPALDNLQNTKELTTIDTAKNVAYVFSPAGFEMVYPPGVDPTTVVGLNRRVLVVDGSSVTSDNPDVSAALIQLGNQALATARVQQSFDGQIRQNSQYVYGRDYFLGDLVTSINVDGIGNEMRVTEQIFNSDAQSGESSYPTLAMYQFLTTGSWLTWAGSKTWSDFESDPITWSELP